MQSSPDSAALWLVLFCGLAFLAAMGGGALPTLIRLTHTRLQVAISFVSGLMLGLGVLHLLPHAAGELRSVDQAAAWLMGGFLLMFLLQRFLDFHHHDVPETEPEHAHAGGCHHHEDAAAVAPGSARPLDWVGIAIGLSIHSLFDGLALASAAVAGQQGHGMALAWGTALAVILHKPFSAMAITTLMAASNAPRRWHHLVNAAFALVTPIGAVLFFLGAGDFATTHPTVLGAALAFSAGTFVCVACADLLPELQFHSHDRIKLSLALVVGLAVAVLIGRFGHASHDHDHLEDIPHDAPHDHDHDHDHDHGRLGPGPSSIRFESASLALREESVTTRTCPGSGCPGDPAPV
jgi:zinc and cadmium transporter